MAEDNHYVFNTIQSIDREIDYLQRTRSVLGILKINGIYEVNFESTTENYWIKVEHFNKESIRVAKIASNNQYDARELSGERRRNWRGDLGNRLNIWAHGYRSLGGLHMRLICRDERTRIENARLKLPDIIQILEDPKNIYGD